MKILKYSYKENKINIIGDKFHQGEDFFIFLNGSIEEAKIVIFFDSRGISKSYNDSLIKMLIDYYIDYNIIVIVRPLELTTWVTLYNFLWYNNVKPKFIITNLGIVDCTPKKKSICKSMSSQIEYSFKSKVKLIPLENYLLSNNKIEKLYTINYPDIFIDQMNKKFARQKIYAIKTPLVDKKIKISRNRPKSFYDQLKVTNDLIDKIKCKPIEVGTFDLDKTYDSVHWTLKGNKLIFNKIIKSIKK